MELTEVQKEADSAGRKAILFGVFAMVIATGFGWLIAHLTSAGPATQPVVVAAADIGPLTTLKAEQLKVIDWPTQSLLKGSFQNVEDVVKIAQMNVNALQAGEPVLAERLSTTDRGLGMSQMVEPNMRAFVVRVDDSVATSEILHPGAFVDVAVTLDDPKTHQPVTKVILQNTQILGVGDSIEVERTKSDKTDDISSQHDVVERHRVVTLLVGVNDIEALSFASRKGEIDLILRNNNDNNVATTQGMTIEKLMARNKPTQGTNEAPGAAAEPAPAAEATPAPQRARRHRSNTQGPSIIKVHR